METYVDGDHEDLIHHMCVYMPLGVLTRRTVLDFPTVAEIWPRESALYQPGSVGGLSLL